MWVLAGRRFFGNWILASLEHDPDDHSGLYIWTVGFVFAAMGMACQLAAVCPTLGVWFPRRKWAEVTLVLALVALVGVPIYFGQSPC